MLKFDVLLSGTIPFVTLTPFRVHSTVLGMGIPLNSHSRLALPPEGIDWKLSSALSPFLIVKNLSI